MAQRDRLESIRTIVKTEKRVVVSELSKQFDVTEETIRRDLEKLEKEPIDTVGYFDDHWKTYAYREKRYFINLDPNDNGGYCQCAKCLKAVGGKKNRLGMQNYSELYFRWVNEVANEVTKKYPDVYFRTFAYTQTYDAPSFPLHPNVIVMLCRELYSGLKPDIRQEWEQTLQLWSRKAQILFVWD